MMGRYELKARRAFEQIEYYYNNAGPRGYSQAKYHYNELAKLLMGAHYSKRDKSDASIIAIFREQAELLMKEMKERQDEFEKEANAEKQEG
jgi:hypothetical protein